MFYRIGKVSREVALEGEVGKWRCWVNGGFGWGSGAVAEGEMEEVVDAIVVVIIACVSDKILEVG